MYLDLIKIAYRSAARSIFEWSLYWKAINVVFCSKLSITSSWFFN